MPVKSLVDLAKAACLKNIRELDSVGDYLPYENVRDILLKVDNAPQLRQIELNSPQVEGETGEIWLRLIERDFPMEYKAKAYKPPDPKKWYRVWEKYKKDHDAALQASEKKLMNALAGLKQDKEKNESRIVDRKQLPRSLRAAAAPARKTWGQPRDPNGATLTFGRGSRTKTVNGASVMRKVRREVKEIASIHGALSRPTHGSGSGSGSSRRTQLNRAPAAMVNDIRRSVQPVFRPAPKEAFQSTAVQEYEQRATFLSDSEDDDQDELFDEDEEEDDDPVLSAGGKSSTRPSYPSPRRPTGQQLASRTRIPPQSSSSTATSLSTKKAANTPVSKRSGILSNSYKPPTAKPPTKPLSSSSAAPAASTKTPKPVDLPDLTKTPTHHLPRTQTSPPPAAAPGPSSPPPLAGSPPPASSNGIPRKRKAPSIFMSRKKRS